MRNTHLIFVVLIVIAAGLWAGVMHEVKTVVAERTAPVMTTPEVGDANVLSKLGSIFNEAALKNAVKVEEVSDPYESRIAYEEAIISAVERVAPAVVSITATRNLGVIKNCIIDPFNSAGIQCTEEETLQDLGAGSGFIVSADGLILTNRHVVSEVGANYTVFLNDGREFSATVLARHPIEDIALIKINAAGLPVAPLGDSTAIRIAQTAIAIGNSLGEFQNTVSVGIISGVSRNIVAGGGMTRAQQLENLLQTDAAINPGNSGGPLINLKGEVIGINTAIVADAQGIGFAIPINSAKRDIRSVQNTGKISVPFVGVRYITLTEDAEIAQIPGVPQRGAIQIESVVTGSPAEKAGLLEKDVITAINDRMLSRGASFVRRIQEYTVGDTVTLTIIRDGRTITRNITFEERPE